MKKRMKKFIIFLLSSFILLLFSCRSAEDKIAVVWSSRAELARYCEIFNASQNDYKIIARYVQDPSKEILNSKKTIEKPDLVIDCWLKAAGVRKNFIKLNSLLAEDKINPDIFYSELLELGKSDGEQLLLPVSFNLPVLIFRDSAIKTSDDFSISLEEIKELAKKYNSYENNSYTKMGFAPIWNPEFLYLYAKSQNANFEEKGDFFSWQENSLNLAIRSLRKYSLETNLSTKAETDFQFKYLYNNAYSAIMSGRCLFQYLRSDELLLLSQEKMANIDFRWLSFDKKTALDDEIVYAGILKSAKNKAVAKAFLQFLFSPESQKAILKENAEKKLSSLGFGIVGGFSSIRSITENSFPTYYPLLLSHLPQSKNFMSPHIFPSNWLQIKKELLLPYLKNACEINEGERIEDFSSLGNYIHKSKTKSK